MGGNYYEAQGYFLSSVGLSIGAGPGGAFSYHGGGHGGRGGGFYQDRNTSKLYGWSYYDTSYLLGGSTGEIKVYTDHILSVFQFCVVLKQNQSNSYNGQLQQT